MGLFDWIGPTSLTKRRGGGALPAPLAEVKAPNWLIDDHRAVIVSPLIHGPGATDLLNAQRGSDSNSAVYACLQVIATAIAEPPLRVYRTKAGDRSEIDDSPLGALLDRPNPHMTLSALLAYLSNCLHIDGNGYWRKLRAGDADTGNVVELWPISPTRIEPKTVRGSGDFISYYRYYLRPGQYEDIPVENIVHFRMGLDDRDHRVGCAPLKRLAREVSSDDQATRYADRLLANLAINGLSVEWDKETAPVSAAQAEEIKARIRSAYGGDNVGGVSVMSPGAKLVSHGFSPEQMDLKVLHQVPEERISAVLGVPAIVAGLGAGLARSTFSNVREAREILTEMKMLPLWGSIADVLTMSLVPDFTSERGVSVAFMIDDVRALQDDQNAKATRLKTYVDAGILTVDEARAEIGHEPRVVLSSPSEARDQRSRPRILTLPDYRGTEVSDWKEVRLKPNEDGVVLWGRPEVKALDDLPAQFGRMKDDVEPDWQSALETFLAAQLARITRALRAGSDTAEGLVAEGEATLLGETLAPLQRAVLADVQRMVMAELGIEFQLDDAASREYLRQAGSQITGITSTTRDAVRAALIEGQAAGEGIPQLAARIRALSAFNRARAITVARTELGHSQNTAALANYRASGVVVGVRVLDSDADPICSAINGRVFALNNPPPTLGHPNCVRAFAPVVDAQEATG